MANINLDTIYAVVEKLEENFVIGAITSATTGEIKDIEACNDEDMLDTGTFLCNTVETYEAHSYEFSYAKDDMLVFSLTDLLAENN